MAETELDDELDLDEDERRRKPQPSDAIGTPIDLRSILSKPGNDAVYRGPFPAPGPQSIPNADASHPPKMVPLDSSAAIGKPIGNPPTTASPMPMETTNSPTTGTLTPPPDSVGTRINLTPPHQRPLYDAYQQQLHNKAGVENVHGFGGALLKGLDIAGSIIAPGQMALIPGTRIHHIAEVNRAANAAENENKEIGSQDTEALQQAEAERNTAAAEEQRALATKNAQPVAKKFENISQLHADAVQDAITRGVDPSKDPRVLQIEDSIQRIQKEPVSPKGNDFDKYYQQWLKDNKQTDTAANQLKAHRDWEVEGGRPVHEPEGSFIPTYDPKTGAITGAWNPKTGQVQHAPQGLSGTTGPGAGIASKTDAAMEKKTAPLKGVIEEANQAATLKDMADKGNAEADVNLALSFFKTMRSAQSGGSGIRFTQQENNLIMGARSLWDSLQVQGNKVFSNGQPLSSTQRQAILDVINVHKQAAERQLQELQAGGNAPPAPAAGAVPTFGQWKATQGKP
jgi:hypothetical protein